MTGDSTESENEIARFRCPKHQNPAIPKQPTKTNAILAQSFSRSSRTTIERGPQVRPEQREAQFIRLRDRVEASTAIKYRATEFEGTPPGIVLRGVDFRP